MVLNLFRKLTLVGGGGGQRGILNFAEHESPAAVDNELLYQSEILGNLFVVVQLKVRESSWPQLLTVEQDVLIINCVV